MENKSNDATSQRPDGKRAIDSPIVKFNLKEATAIVRNEIAYKSSDRNAITLFKSDHQTMVLICFHAGAEMKDLVVEGTSIFQVLEGKVDFNMNGNKLTLIEGEIVAVHARLPHGIKALSACSFLLTIYSSK